MRKEDLIVEVRDANLQRVGSIRPEDLVLDLTAVHNNIGDWKVSLPSEHPLAKALKTPGSGLIVAGPTGVILSGPTTNPELVTSADDPAGTVTFTGVGDAVILQDALAWPDPSNSNVSTQAVAYDERTGLAEDLMHAYVDANVGTTASAARKNKFLSLRGNQHRGATITKQARFPTLGNLLSEIAAPNDLGFRVFQEGTALVFETYGLRDLSRAVRLSTWNGELLGQKVSTAAPGLTRAIVGGSGLDEGRTFVEVSNVDSLAAETSWGRRIERFVDQRSDTVAELTQAGTEVLAEEGTTAVGVQVTPADDSDLRFGVDYGLGDVVTAEVEGGVESSVQVTGVVVKADTDGLRVGVALGDLYAFSSADAISKVAQIDQRVSNLERNVEVAVQHPVSDTGWILLPLGNGWSNWNGFAPAAYRKVGDFVYLRGLVSSGAFPGSAFATLPGGFRPPANEIFSVQANGNTVVRLDVQATGVLQAPQLGATNAFVNLSGIVFTTS